MPAWQHRLNGRGCRHRIPRAACVRAWIASGICIGRFPGLIRAGVSFAGSTPIGSLSSPIGGPAGAVDDCGDLRVPDRVAGREVGQVGDGEPVASVVHAQRLDSRAQQRAVPRLADAGRTATARHQRAGGHLPLLLIDASGGLPRGAWLAPPHLQLRALKTPDHSSTWIRPLCQKYSLPFTLWAGLIMEARSDPEDDSTATRGPTLSQLIHEWRPIE